MVFSVLRSAQILSRAGFSVDEMSTEKGWRRKQELADVTLVMKDACKGKSR